MTMDADTRRSNDWIELLALVARYSRGLDTKDYALFRSCFAEPIHVVYDVSTVGVSGDRLTFHDLDRLVEESKRIHAPLHRIMHRNTNQSFVIDGDRATGRVYVDLFQVRLQDRAVPETTHHLGWYDDVYVRTADGWRFSERHYVTNWSEGGWLGAEAGPAPVRV
jgi:hypothetical protein